MTTNQPFKHLKIITENWTPYSAGQDGPQMTLDEFETAINDYFRCNPDTDELWLYGYIPGFNDGDPCVHSASQYEKYLYVDANMLTDEEEEDLVYPPFNHWDWRNPDPNHKGFDNAFNEAFGTNCTAVIKRDGTITLSTYECGY